jgi:hypothetical protein
VFVDFVIVVVGVLIGIQVSNWAGEFEGKRTEKDNCRDCMTAAVGATLVGATLVSGSCGSDFSRDLPHIIAARVAPTGRDRS